ncbi:MAG: tRNA uridine-5-carboxymethylaminomethyl(34) synthesis GTPase MnmE [Novosphingobium sp.]|nr:tRNA uridine-5-carboxymethylaminomethyl(34) synthesis GTPase MnmE [Novosphingobium sp.]MBO9602396.1 tRNA uridine-5-carboxymethylaminomethyl(34) synthesis GTPase MnmE [Novosphingobium sp.]
MDTIFALSSGLPPAAIAVVRISGPLAGPALATLAGGLPLPRHASLRRLRDRAGTPLDDALALWFPGPDTATGEDLAELHLHGGRAVVAGVERALGALAGLRRAEPGEFTRRAFANGRIDLAEAEGLADLLAAETELQRRAALDLAGGALSRRVDGWRDRLLILSAALEAVLDFADEDDVAALPPGFAGDVAALRDDLGTALDAPHAEALREGFRVVLAGPPNAGKSTLFNALVESEAAITAASPGTTRDVLVRPVAIGGIPFSFIDTAGLRDEGAGEIEAIGIERALAEFGRADCVLWLGPEGEGPAGAWEIAAQVDRGAAIGKAAPRAAVSALTGEGMAGLKEDLVATAMRTLARPGTTALNARQRALVRDAAAALEGAIGQADPLLLAEQLRLARVAFDRLTGRAATEDVLDALFGRFCIGK